MKELLDKINKIIIEKSFVKNKVLILDFLKNSQFAYYFFNKLPTNFSNLSEIEFLLDEALRIENYYVVIKILTGSLGSDNNGFIIKFITNNYEKFAGNKLKDELFQEEALEVVKKLLESDRSQVNSVFRLVKKVVKLAGNEYKEDRYDHKREKEYVADLLLSMSDDFDETEINETIELIKEKFDLTDGGFRHINSTHSIFNILRKYLESNFKDNFDKVINLLIYQYDENYGDKFDGWEWSGAGVNRAGNNFSLNDISFVEYVLIPATRKFYEENNDLEFLISKMVTKTADVKKNRPDFLNRAILPIIVDLYSSDDVKKVSFAYDVLKEFIESTKGIPSKSDLIFQYILSSKLSDEKIWKLALIDAEKYDTPTSVFLERNISNLAARGHVDAKRILKKWQKNPKYYQGFTGSTSITSAITSQLGNNLYGAVELFRDFISNDGFVNDKYDRFEVYDLARALSRIIEKNFKIGLEILNDLKNKEKLGVNEQILLCNAISNIDVKVSDFSVVTNLYDYFIDPFLSEFDNIEKIIKKIPYDNGREQFVKFAECLVVNGDEGEIKKALRIIEIFVKDPDPYLPSKDPNGAEYNEHARIERGETDPTITSVRGWCGWVLMKASVLKGRSFIDEIIDLTEELSKDENYYVQHMACLALSRLANIRLTHLENSEEMYLDSNRKVALQKAKRIEKIAFNLLERIISYNNEAKKSLARSILSVFNAIRSLNYVDALKFVSAFKNNFPPEAIGEAAPLFIFFAEFRENAYEDWKWKEVGLYDDLEPFDSSEFKNILEDIVKSKELEIRKQFTFKFCTLIDEGEELFNVSLKYLNLITDQDFNDDIDDICRSIYNFFIPKQIDKHFVDCYRLWKKCLSREIIVLNDNYDNKIPNSVPNWIEREHGEVLLKVKDKMGDSVFLDDLELFTKFPKGVDFYGISSAINKLKEFPKNNDQVSRIYDALIVRNPSYYDDKESWQNGVNHVGSQK